MWTHVEKCLFIVGQETYNTFSDTTVYQLDTEIYSSAKHSTNDIQTHTHADSRTEN